MRGWPCQDNGIRHQGGRSKEERDAEEDMKEAG